MIQNQLPCAARALLPNLHESLGKPGAVLHAHFLGRKGAGAESRERPQKEAGRLLNFSIIHPSIHLLKKILLTPSDIILAVIMEVHKIS